MSLYLARADRVVVGADLTMASPRLAEGARRRFELTRVRFVESDLNRPGLSEGVFDVVYCSGVLHHTREAWLRGNCSPGPVVTRGAAT